MKSEKGGSATYGLLVEECAKFGISRTVAFKLSASGLLKTFAIGTRRYVYLESLRTLPGRLLDPDNARTVRRARKGER
jgi:hypothetical protein